VRDVVAHDDLGIFLQSAENPTQGKRGAETIAVRPDVGGDGESFVLFN
jgi:hypothetical protein